MTKETLTIEHIRGEFKQEKKERKSLLFGACIFLVILILLTVWMIKLSGFLIVLAVFFGAWALLFMLVVATLTQDIVKIQHILNQEICIVKDKLIGKGLVVLLSQLHFAPVIRKGRSK